MRLSLSGLFSPVDSAGAAGADQSQRFLGIASRRKADGTNEPVAVFTFPGTFSGRTLADVSADFQIPEGAYVRNYHDLREMEKLHPEGTNMRTEIDSALQALVQHGITPREVPQKPAPTVQ